MIASDSAEERRSIKGILSKVIIGTAQVDSSYRSAKSRTDQPWSNVLATAHQLGITKLDTAVNYSGAHELIGNLRWQGEIHTKVSGLDLACSEFENALELLGKTSVEIVYFHDHRVALDFPDQLSHAAKMLLEQGAGKVGISVYEPNELIAALEIPEISVFQIPVNPLNQSFLGETLAQAKEANKKIIARSVFFRGLLLRESPSDSARVSKVTRIALRAFAQYCSQVNKTPLEVCLEFVHQVKEIDEFVVGVESINELDQLRNALLALASSNSRVNLDHLALHAPDHSDLRKID